MKSILVVVMIILTIIMTSISVLAISNVQQSIDGNKLTLSYEGTPPFMVNIRGDENIGSSGGYIWAKTYDKQISLDLNNLINSNKIFYYSIKDSSETWSAVQNVEVKDSLYVIKNTNDILKIAPFIWETKTPVIVYVPGREDEIINLISAMKKQPNIKLISDDKNFGNLENRLNGFGFEKVKPYDLINSNYQSIIFSNEAELKPYASLYAAKNNGLFFDSLVDVQNYISRVPSKKIIYFGMDELTRTQLASYSPNGISETINALQNAEIKLASTTSVDKIVTVIPKIPSDYSNLGVLYAVYRDTALVSITGNSDDAFSFDENLNSQLNLIKPYNNNEEYQYMVIASDWNEIPYNYPMPTHISTLPSGIAAPYRYSADMMYADRNSYWSTTDINDEDLNFIPDISVGRILGYDLTSASIILNIGKMREDGKLLQNKQAVYSSDFAFDAPLTLFQLNIVNKLNTMYGSENVYAESDPAAINQANNADRDKILNLAKNKEFILLQGHGAQNYLSATSPAITGDAILSYRTYKSALWWLSACDTVRYCPNCAYTLLDGSLRSLATNVYGSVAILQSNSGIEKFYTPYLALGYRFGDVVRLGLNDARDELKTWMVPGANLQIISQLELIGDPLVTYGNVARPTNVTQIPKSAFQTASTDTAEIKISNSMLNIITLPTQNYNFRFNQDCGKMIIIETKEGVESIKDITSFDYDTIKQAVTPYEQKIDVTQDQITALTDSFIVSEKNCKIMFNKI